MRKPESLLEYLQGYTNYFFEWIEGGEVVILTVTNKSTICYREYLFDVLRSLAGSGVPNLGTLLLCIKATDAAGFEDFSAPLYEIMVDLYAVQFPKLEEYEEVNAAFAFLGTLSQLPLAYKTGSRRLQVLQAIFQDGHNLISGKVINRLLGHENAVQPYLNALCNPEEEGKKAIHRDISPLALLHKKFPDTAAILNTVAGLPPIEELPQLPEVLPTQSLLPPANFVEELEQNETTFHIGSLLPSIWAGLHILLHNRQPSTQPLGGISDISNRGTLDKLLISEHAYDDLLALSRLANGEALYYRREVPPEAQSRGRTLLLDVSLQGWGTPHTVNFALLIAIAMHPKTDIACTAFAVGDQVQPLKFRTVHEVIDSLSLLEATTDAAGGVEAFFHSQAAPKGCEVFFLTSPAGFRQVAVQRVLNVQKNILYCLVASAAGECTVYKRVGVGLQKVQEFTLPLGKLWKRERVETERSGGTSADSLTLSTKYPILFPRPQVVKQFLKTADGTTYAVSRERTLMLRETGESHKGWIPVLEGLPGGPCKYEIGLNEAKEPVFLCFVVNTRELFLYNLGSGEKSSTVLSKEEFGKGIPVFLSHPQQAAGDPFLMQLRQQTWSVPMRANAGNSPLSPSNFTKTAFSEVEFNGVHKERQDQNEKNTGCFTGNTFKHLKDIFIDNNAKLIVNKKVLLSFESGQNGYFELSGGPIGAAPFRANCKSNSFWEFSDGSKIFMNNNGMLILESGNEALETIYLPSVLGVGVGMATASHFAGNNFYRSLHTPAQKVISTTEFYRLHIQPFIDHIVNHGA